jgi:hypothetical protein
LRQQKDRLKRNNIEVLVVTFEQEEHAFNYRQETELDWPLVVDSSRELYSYYGMEKAGFWDLWGPATWRVYFQEIFKGNRPRPASDDVYQRGGNVLINPAGMVRLHHISKGPADRPRVESILQIVEEEDSRTKLYDEVHHLKN